MSSLIKKLIMLFIVASIGIVASLSVSEKFGKEYSEKFHPKDKKSWVGDYLAGYHAMQNSDYQKASDYFSDSIKLGETNAYLESKTLTLLLVSGQYEDAFKIAKQIYDYDESAISGLTLIAKHAEESNFTKAVQLSEELKKEGQNTIIHQLLHAWAKLGEGNKLAAQNLMATLAKNGSIEPLVSYHYALISDLSGNEEKAHKLYKNIIKRRNITNAVATAAYNFFEKVGDEESKKKILDKFKDEENSLEYHKVDTAQKGMAEAFLGIAGIIMSEYRSDKSAAFFRLSLYLNPNLEEAKMLLGTILTSEGDLTGANEILEKIDSASYLSNYARLAIARNYRTLENDTKAKQYYLALLEEENSRMDALVSLGDIERSIKNWKKAEEYYSLAIKDIEAKTDEYIDPSVYWPIYFARGVSFERMEEWNEAEKDMQKALELEPDQPEVLNYLAYTWTDMGINLEEAKEMLLKAYEQRPGDAHILDSVGWAYYKLGEVEKAVDYIEESASLIPYDPTVNEHLGDIYWEIGRKTEAKYQWQRALENEPETDRIPEIEAKLNQDKVVLAVDEKADETESPR